MNVKLLILLRIWLGGTLLGPKRTILRHTSPIFLIVALLRLTKIRFVWQKNGHFFVSDATTLTSYFTAYLTFQFLGVKSF